MTSKYLYRKRAVALIVQALLGFALFAAGTSEQPGTKAADSSPAVPASQKKLDITWIASNQIGNPTEQGSPVQKLIEERFNVSLTVPVLDIYNKEQFQLYFASGKTADHITINGDGNALFKLVDQGVLRSVERKTLEKYLPKYLARVYQDVDPSIVWAQNTYKGKVWSVPYIGFDASYVGALRKDWLDNLGIAKAPATLDELHSLLVRFTRDDPDRNGKNDTYGIHGGASTLFNYVHGAFGAWPQSYTLRDGKVVYSDTLPEYRDSLKLLAAWFKEGVIDPEFTTDTRDIQRKKWAEGRFGVLFDHPWWFSLSTGANVTQILVDKNPGARLLFFAPVTGPSGKSGARTYYPMTNEFPFLFGKNTSDEKVERILAIKESFAADWDWYVRAFYGEAGRDYRLDDGVITPFGEALKPEYKAKRGIGNSFALTPTTFADTPKLFLKTDAEPYGIGLKANKLYLGVGFTFPGNNEAFSQYGTDIETISREFYFNAITGKVDVDKDWEGFITALQNAGLRKVIEGYQKGYDSLEKNR